jgi:putative OPT family oligopeptide transporter
MAAQQTIEKPKSPPKEVTPAHRPFVADNEALPEFTWQALILGSVLGILFGASSLYLVLKVGLTVSASIPVAVLAITLFRVFSRITGTRRATILENNIVQTTGSAGESIAFGVGVTIPALMLLGGEMEFLQVMTVGTLGALLGILMMIPLRRAFIVKQHGVLTYPEGTACADVLIAGEQGGATAATVFTGFGLAFVYKFLTAAMGLWKEVVKLPLVMLQKSETGATTQIGLRGGALSGELSPELLGVGYIIGPRIASLMLGGGVLAWLVITPLIVLVGADPAAQDTTSDQFLGMVRENYVLYIGAGAVATGGIISMIQALPMIFGSVASGLRDMRSSFGGAEAAVTPRTSRDLPIWVTVLGSIALVLILTAVPGLGLGFNPRGIAGALLIVLFGFLFVTVSARLTGEVGSSSNPISGMTVATLLLTCLIFLAMNERGPSATFTALMVAAVVCIAASNGGTTAQDLKTGYLVGGTPRLQQYAIVIGALTSASVIGGILILMNSAGTVWSADPRNLPNYRVPDVTALTRMEQPGGEHAAKDKNSYHVLYVRQKEIEGVPAGKYLVDNSGQIRYLVDPAINGRLTQRDDGTPVKRFEAPKTRLMALIIDGILNQRLPWTLVLLGALIAITLELAGTSSLPFAVGVYLPLSTSVPIFIGGALRWVVDKLHGRSAAEAEMSPGVLLSSGYIAGGAIAGLLIAFMALLPNERVDIPRLLRMEERLPDWWHAAYGPEYLALGMFALLLICLFVVGLRKQRNTK